MFVVAPRRDERIKDRRKQAIQSLPPYESMHVGSLRESCGNLLNLQASKYTGSMSMALLAVGMLSVASRLAVSTCC